MLDLNMRLRDISRAGTAQQLWDTTVAALKGEGIDMFSYHMVDAQNATITVLAEGFPEDWVATYVANNYISVDPIPELASRMSEPFFWHDVGGLVDHTPEVDRYLDAMEDANLGDGLALFVFGPGLRNAYVGLGFSDADNLPDREQVSRLHCLVQAAHLRFCALSDPGEEPMLTARETEILKWIARGKSNSVIADILGISPHTVDAHLRSVYRKLDVSDRTMAAVKGVGAALVAYPDHGVT